MGRGRNKGNGVMGGSIWQKEDNMRRIYSMVYILVVVHLQCRISVVSTWERRKLGISPGAKNSFNFGEISVGYTLRMGTLKTQKRDWPGYHLINIINILELSEMIGEIL